ncbi:uncharacterized protein TNIN_253651 [Trichonephila inaurata madagascariensis]|uniref:Uncharacterized protein n=1 Tax=Trichonephila inaurata madagascariensis TaxID=2747483 RepID=A0A8X7C3N8_9ARAC|nr:uncharacterized protein TNIN_253651 [Trichonephila inaurata madagascariensis]
MKQSTWLPIKHQQLVRNRGYHFGPVQELGSFRRNYKKICHSTARETPKKKIKCLKTGRQSKLFDRKSLTDLTNSKNKVHQRKSVQYKSICSISFIEKEDLSNGYALRSRISDFVRVTRSNSSFLTPTVHKPLQKKRCSQKHLGKRNPTRISVKPKQQSLVNQEMSSSSASTSGLGRKTRSSSSFLTLEAHEPLQKKFCSQKHMGRRKSTRISVEPKQQSLVNQEISLSSTSTSDFGRKTRFSSCAAEKIQQKSHQRKSSRNLCKEKENIERPLRKRSKEIPTDDILTTPASRSSTLRNPMKSSTPKLNLKLSKRKLDNLDIETKVASEIVPWGKMEKKLKGSKLDLENSTRSSTSRKSGRKSFSPIKVVHEPVINTRVKLAHWIP